MKLIIFFLWSRFSTKPKSQDKSLNISWTKRAFNAKWKVFLIIFKGLSIIGNCLRPESGPLSEHMSRNLNKFFCSFRRAHFTQHVLFKLLQRWQNELENKGFVGTIFMDLSKGYDCLPHDLIIAKFKSYGTSKVVLKLLLNYLTSRKQRIKIGSSNIVCSLT